MSEQRISRLQSGLQHRALDALIVGSLPHIRYLTNFTGSHAVCVIRPRTCALFTDSRYARQCAIEVRGISCKITKLDLIEAVVRSGAFRRSTRVGFESEFLSYKQFRNLKRLLPGKRLVPVEGMTEALTGVKDDAEVRYIRSAVSISEKVFEKIKGLIRPGVTELDIAAEISYLHRHHGGERDAFEPIVASGRRSALPHARATGKKIKKGDLVVLDFGCSVNGYHSDITRTMAIGKASGEARRMHAVVLSASNKAIRSAAAGMHAKELDRVARKEIARAGMAKYFVHALGHGLGMQVHERPRISALSKDILKAGNVVTIEPGVYIPSIGGVRIEDDVLITQSGCEVLSHTSKELFVA